MRLTVELREPYFCKTCVFMDIYNKQDFHNKLNRILDRYKSVNYYSVKVYQDNAIGNTLYATYRKEEGLAIQEPYHNLP